MDLSPESGTHECPTCGVDAARAFVVSATVAFYHPTWTCPRCVFETRTFQQAANHAAKHEPDVLAYVQSWIESNPGGWDIRRRER